MHGMILAAGRGERMRPLTDHTPKPLLKVGHQTLIEWQMERLIQAGVTQLVINTAHLGEQIPGHLGDGSRHGAQIRYSPEPPGALETAGGIATAEPWCFEDSSHPLFALANGDVFIDLDWGPLLKFCDSQWPQDAQAMLVMVPNPDHHPKGDFLAPSQMLGLPYQLETMGPSEHTQSDSQTYAGVGVFHRSLFAHCTPGVRAPLGPLLRQAASAGQLWGWLHEGLWVDVGTPERLSALNERIK
ncbi:MAG: hypothetical protein RL320_1584 [Pseudomonadota bacterium]|jgi:MurNAc alpha-1-phosphate uridylyltransferase